MTLAASGNALHARAGGVGLAAEQAQAGCAAQVVQGDGLGRVLRKLALQRTRYVGGDEQLDLVVRDAAADVVPPLSKMGVAVGEDLRVRRQQVITVGCQRGEAGRVLPLGLFAPKVHRGVIGGAFTPCIVRKGAGS